MYVALAQRKEDREAQKLNLRYARGPMPAMPPQQMPGQWPNTAGFPNGIANMQAQQPGYLLPITPSGPVRGFYPNNIPGQVPGQLGQNVRGPRTWQANAHMGRHPMATGYNPTGYRGANPRAAQQGIRPQALQANQVPLSNVRQFNPAQRNPNTHRVQTARQPKMMTNPMGGMPVTFVGEPNKPHNPEDSLQLLGEQLFSAIYPINADLAGKITGMILEMNQPEIVSLLSSGELLKAKVDEAVKVLSEHADNKPLEAE